MVTGSENLARSRFSTPTQDVAVRSVLQIGAGSWGASWLSIVKEHPLFELAAVVDLDEPTLQRAASIADLTQDRCFATVDDALTADIQADVTLVAVPPPAHVSIAVKALEAGLDCLIEKPLADAMDGARRIIEAADHAGKTTMVSQNYRFKRAPRTVRRLVQQGIVGRVENVQIDFQKNPPFTGFRLEMEEPLITDMAVHHLDQIRGIAGLEPLRIRARSWNPSWSQFTGNPCCLIELEALGGAFATYTGSWVSRAQHTTWDGSWEIQGERGSLRWADNRIEIRFASLFDTVFMPGAVERGGVMHVELDTLVREERAGVLDEFAAALDQGRTPETDVKDNIKSLALVLAAVESAKRGGKEIDLAQFGAG